MHFGTLSLRCLRTTQRMSIAKHSIMSATTTANYTASCRKPRRQRKPVRIRTSASTFLLLCLTTLCSAIMLSVTSGTTRAKALSMYSVSSLQKTGFLETASFRINLNTDGKAKTFLLPCSQSLRRLHRHIFGLPILTHTLGKSILDD